MLSSFAIYIPILLIVVSVFVGIFLIAAIYIFLRDMRQTERGDVDPQKRRRRFIKELDARRKERGPSDWNFSASLRRSLGRENPGNIRSPVKEPLLHETKSASDFGNKTSTSAIRSEHRESSIVESHLPENGFEKQIIAEENYAQEKEIESAKTEKTATNEVHAEKEIDGTKAHNPAKEKDGKSQTTPKKRRVVEWFPSTTPLSEREREIIEQDQPEGGALTRDEVEALAESTLSNDELLSEFKKILEKRGSKKS